MHKNKFLKTEWAEHCHSSLWASFKDLLFLFIYVHLCECISLVYRRPGTKRGCWMLWVWSYSQLWAATVGQESNWSSRRAACAPNYWPSLQPHSASWRWMQCDRSLKLLGCDPLTMGQSKPFLPRVLLSECFIAETENEVSQGNSCIVLLPIVTISVLLLERIRGECNLI